MKPELVNALARAAAASRAALIAEIKLELARERNRQLEREINQKTSVNIRATAERIVAANDLPGWFAVAEQLAADPSLISLAALSIKPRKIAR